MLLNKTMQIKIADLGVSKIIDMDRTNASTYAGTIPYMSPEVFRSQTDDVKYYPNTDVWYIIGFFMFVFIIGD
jgi:serine/threonine protein kinase